MYLSNSSAPVRAHRRTHPFLVVVRKQERDTLNRGTIYWQGKQMVPTLH